ncbi:MAG: TolC family protein [Candidatus Riflebacteria bacterium]|nr:TolC family protein [Candidatus Riflebacteria bacterium]
MTSSKLAANELPPDLSLAGTVVDKGSWSRTDAGATTVEQREGVRQTWQVEAALTLPIENLAARAENERARQEVQEKRLALSQVETTVSQEIRSARRAVEMGLARLRQTQVAARHAANHLEAEGRLLDLGLTDTFRLLQVEEEASQARLAETQALVDYLSAITRYELSLGIIAEKYTRGRTAAVSRR